LGGSHFSTSVVLPPGLVDTYLKFDEVERNRRRSCVLYSCADRQRAYQARKTDWERANERMISLRFYYAVSARHGRIRWAVASTTSSVTCSSYPSLVPPTDGCMLAACLAPTIYIYTHAPDWCDTGGGRFTVMGKSQIKS